MKKLILIIVPMLLWVYSLNAQTVYTFIYTGAVQTFTVPVGINALQIEVYGAAGGDGAQGRTGGKGGYSKGYLTVTPGQVINIYVGGQGGTVNTISSFASGGYNGGGNAYLASSPDGPVGAGGGASDVRVSPYTLADRVIVAGGGGGAAGSGWMYGDGGSGGGNIGGNANSESGYTLGGSQTAGGVNPHNSNYNGHLGTGGNVATNYYHSSGGGGGYYGGAAGIGSGGAGGSGYIGGTLGGTTSTGVRSGNGQVIIKAGTLQEITFNVLSPVTFGDASFTISATPGGSGNPVTFTSSDNSVAQCSGTNGATITIKAAGTCTIYANEAGSANYLQAPQVSQTLTVNKKAVTITGVTASNKVYDGTNTASLTTGSINGLVGYDSYYVSITKGTGTFNDKNVDLNKPVTATGYQIVGYYSSNYYLLSQPSGITANITPKALTVTNAAVAVKTYDGTTQADISGATLSGIVGSEDVTLENTTSGDFSQSGAGTGISVLPAMTITGADIANYTLTQPTLAGDILPKALTVANAIVTNKEYDGTTHANISGATLSDVIAPDDVALANETSGDFSQVGIGSTIPVTSAMTLTGTTAANYTLTQPTLSGDILLKALTVANATITDKEYDGTTHATITGAELSGVIGSEDVTLENTTSGVFSQSGAGTGISVVPTMAITGADIANYTLTQPTLAGDILLKALTVTNATVTPKTYDGTTHADISGATLSGVIGSEEVTLENTTSGDFSQPGAGTGISVMPAMTITGADIANYTLTQPTLAGDILPKALTVANATVTDKEYDGTTHANISGATLSGVIAPDDIALANETSGDFSQTGIGSTIPVTSAMTLTGITAANYTLTQPILAGDILPKALIVANATVTDKEYDGTTHANISGSTLSGVIAPDEVTLANETSGDFSQTGIGSTIPVTSAMTLTGTTAANYTLTQPILAGDILFKALTVANATVTPKTYDGTSHADISGAILSGVIGSEEVTLENTTSGVFSQSGAGTGISVVPAMTITGADIGNYTLTQPTLAGDILPKALIVANATVTDKEYDCTTHANISGVTLSGVIAPDDVALANETSGDFSQTGIGSTIPVTLAMTLTGTMTANYTLTQPTLSGDILLKALTVANATVTPKTYDGTTHADISGATLSGVIGSEDVTLENTTSGVFSQSGAGTGISVVPTMAITGADIGNYTLTQPTLAGDILPKVLIVGNATVTDKEYDGTTHANISGVTLSGVLAPDDVALANETSGDFSQTGIGSDIPVTSAMTLTGTTAANYTLTQPILSGNINPAGLTATADNCSKIYGDTNPTFYITYDGFVHGENEAGINVPIITCPATQTSNAGTYDIILSGGSASNYHLILKNGTLTINKAILIVTADNFVREQGKANPTFTLNYSGFKNTDTDMVLDSKPVATCTADASSTPGDYDINVSKGSDNNYDFNYLPGKLTVTPSTGYLNATTAGYLIYPNPCMDYLIIKSPATGTVKIKIYDMSGKLVIECNVVNERIGLECLAPGLYYLKINEYSMKIIKN